MGNLSASYRLVYFQPDPEDGERVSVALLYTANGDADVLYDPAFSKLKCLAPDIDPDIVKMYLEELKTSLRARGADVDTLARQYAPHLTTSEKRKLSWPLTDELRVHLLQRFLRKGEYALTKQEAKAHKTNQIKEHLRLLINRTATTSVSLKEDAKPDWVVGAKIRRKINTVAFALRKENGVVLIDGVDLSVMKPKAAASRVGSVAYTFLQYGRVRQMGFFDRQVLRRVGIVMNGATNPNQPDYSDIHDFAVQEFKRDADLVVDTASPDALGEFKKTLAFE
jgi:hypothetical protein